MRVNNVTGAALQEARKLPTAQQTAGASFGDQLALLLDKVELPQQEAARQTERLALGEGNLHEAALALEKADITMRLAVKTRNKAVEAYQELMRMQV